MYMLFTIDPLEIQEHKETESKGMEKGIPCKWKSKEKQNTYVGEKRL